MDARIRAHNEAGGGRATLWLPLILYLGISLAFFGHAPSWRQYYFGYTTDVHQFIWFLAWWPFALRHGLNPFITHYVWFPAGFNLTWATAVPLLALLMAPVTWAGGAVLSFNILTLAAPALAAWTTYLLGYELTGNIAAALAGGFILGFSPAEYAELVSELNLDTICLAPLMLWLCARHIRGKTTSRNFILWMTLTMLAQMGISTEMLATDGMMGALSWAICLLLVPAHRNNLWRLARDIWLAAALTALLSAPFLYYLIQGLPDVPPVMNPPVLGSGDLVSFLVPTIPAHGLSDALHGILLEFAGFRPDRAAYLSPPLVILAGIYFVKHRRAPYARALLLILAMLSLFTLGPILHFNGRLTAIHMPWALASHIPLLRAVLPGRFTIYITLAAALALTLCLAATKPGGGAAFALALLACLVSVPRPPIILPPPWTTQPFLTPQPRFVWSPWPETAFFTPAHARQSLPGRPNVLILPLSSFGPGMAWQVDADFAFTQSEGYVGFEPPREQPWRNLRDTLQFGRPDPNLAADIASYCATHHVDDILLGPGTSAALARTIDTLHWPTRQDLDVTIVQVK